MCMFRDQRAPVTPGVAMMSGQTAPGTPTKTSGQVQQEAEERRIRMGLSQYGLASTVVTGGFGDTTRASTSGVSLGV